MLEKLLQQLVAFFKSKNIEVKEDELKTEIETVIKNSKDGEIDLSKLDLSKLGKSGDDPVVKALLEQNQVLVESVNSLKGIIEQERSERDDAKKKKEDEEKAAQEKKIEDTLKKALDDKKITEGDKERWKTKLEKDFDWASDDLKNMEVKKQFKQTEKKEGETTNVDEKNKDQKDLVAEAKQLMNDNLATKI